MLFPPGRLHTIVSSEPHVDTLTATGHTDIRYNQTIDASGVKGVLLHWSARISKPALDRSEVLLSQHHHSDHSLRMAKGQHSIDTNTNTTTPT